MPSIADLLDEYELSHRHPTNTLIHWIAEPLAILALLGHKIEGRVPSVFQNPNLIFVGPVWLMRRIFRRLGLADP